MLVLNRKVGQEIQIGPFITIMVTEIVGKQVRLGITAPTDIPIHRKEILDAESNQGYSPKN